MCGLAGIYFKKGNGANNGVIEKMTAAIAHRGPDAAGYFKDDFVHLGHRRLSIIDLSEASNQPLYDASKNNCIIFNGEIFNYKELKEELNNYPFTTNGDGEVVLAAYLTWGAACLEKFKGFFAFVIYNKESNKLFAARDKMGVKPFYYFKDDNYFVFASEIRAILSTGFVPKELDTVGLQSYLQMQSVQSPYTIIKNVKQLEAAHYIVIDKKEYVICKYWDKTDTKKIEGNAPSTYDEAKQNVRKLLTQSVQRRLVADVPVAAFLSGGIDSSAVVALMAEQQSTVETFNIGFVEKEFDESGYAEIIAKKFNTKHHKITLTPNHFLSELENALDAMDNPSADGANSYVISKAIKQNGLKVAITGAGGDELFAGYHTFYKWLKLNQYKSFWKLPTALRNVLAAPLPSSGKMAKLKELLTTPQFNLESFYAISRQIFDSTAIEKLTKNKFSYAQNNEHYSKFPLLSQYTIAELNGYTQNTLLKDTDQFSMAVALEVREPFFDTDLVAYTLTIPDKFKKGTYPKQLLVESLGDLLPDEIVHRKKMGFSFPWHNWIKNELNSFCNTRIEKLAARTNFDSQAVLSVWDGFQAGSVHWSRVWTLVVLEHWLQKNIDE